MQEDSDIEGVGATATILTLQSHDVFVRYAHKLQSTSRIVVADLPAKSNPRTELPAIHLPQREGNASTVCAKCSSECLGNGAHLLCCHCSAARSWTQVLRPPRSALGFENCLDRSAHPGGRSKEG